MTTGRWFSALGNNIHLQSWLRPSYAFKPCSGPHPPPANNAAGAWRGGIELNLDVCRRLGMREPWLRFLERGPDIMLDSAQPLDDPIPNYPSIGAAHCSEAEADAALMQHAEAGFAELVDARPSLVHPLGAVPKAGP